MQSAFGSALIRHRSTVVQRKGYSTTAASNRLGLKGAVDVNVGETEIRLAGTLKDGTGKPIKATGTVYLPEYKTSENRGTAPVEATTRSGWDNFWSPADALRVKNLTADPRGMRLGQLLTLHHGQAAKKRGKEHVLAMNVSDARVPFYEPLGFTEYDASRPYAMLKRQKDGIDEFLRSPNAQHLPQKQLQEHLQQRQALIDEMAESALIISSDALIANSAQAVRGMWDPVD
jgi:hypothetical protein